MNKKKAYVDMVVLAAGKGTRMRLGTNKMFQKIKSIPILYRTLFRLNELSIIRRIVVVIQEGERSEFDAMIQNYGVLHKIEAVINGGTKRHDSVRKGLSYIHQNPLSEIVMTHDGARPFFTVQMIKRLAEKSRDKSIVIPVLGVNETVRQKDSHGVTQIIDRDRLFLTQTPQALKIDDILGCFLSENPKKVNFTDEAGYFEHLGLAVSMVDGEKWNIKITTEEDLKWSEFLLENYQNLRLDPLE
jgi:2-C-methyl-D-erythritol 4-phosphate cytidylyltransferase